MLPAVRDLQGRGSSGRVRAEGSWMPKRIASITSRTGQDGSYLGFAELVAMMVDADMALVGGSRGG